MWFRNSRQRIHARRQKVRMSVRKQFGEPHDLEVDTRDPKRTVIKPAFDLTRMQGEIQLGPRALKPDVVEVRPMDSRTSVRVFDAYEFRVRIALSKRAS